MIGRMLVADRPSAAERLERKVGVRLATLLCSALTGDQGYKHSWQETAEAPWPASTENDSADARSADASPLHPEIGRIVVLHPEQSTAVSPGMGRNKKQRMVSPVGASETRARKAALNQELKRARSTASGDIELACECGDEGCPARVVLSPDEYAFLRKVPGYYAVSPDHASPDDHIIVGEAGRFAIVE